MVSRPSILDRSRPSLVDSYQDISTVTDLTSSNTEPKMKTENFTRTSSPDATRTSPLTNTVDTTEVNFKIGHIIGD